MIGFNRRIFVNDLLRAVQRTIDNFGRAAHRTLARQVWSPWIDNAAYSPDGLAWFHAAHSNLQAAALSAVEVKAAVLKLLLMTEPGSGERVGLRLGPGRIWLMVPPQLWDTAYGLNQTPGDALYHLFGVNNEQIIVNPLLADTNDWGVHRSAGDTESVRVDFLQGAEEPTIEAATDELASNVFMRERYDFKLRHEYGVALADVRGAVKAVVA